MKKLIKSLGNLSLLVVGFFSVLFGTSRLSHYNDNLNSLDAGGVAHADAPGGGFHCDGTSCTSCK